MILQTLYIVVGIYKYPLGSKLIIIMSTFKILGKKKVIF
jgi:hypothetical protein